MKQGSRRMITRQYDVLLNNISDGVIGVSCDGLINYCNTVAQRRIGGDFNLVGQPFPCVFAQGDPNHGVSWRFSFFPDLILRQEKMFSNHGRLIDSDGTIFNVCYKFVPLSPEYEIEGGLLIFNEPTQRRHDDTLTELPTEVALGETLEQFLSRGNASKKLLDELLARLNPNSGTKP